MKFWKKHFLLAEFALGVLLTAVFIFWMEKSDGHNVLYEALNNRRTSLYGALASVVGALLGFAIAAAAIAMTLAGGPEMKVVRQSAHFKDLGRIFVSATRWLGLATIASISGLVFDTDQSSLNWLLYFFVFTLVVSGLRLWRCVWALDKMTDLYARASDGG